MIALGSNSTLGNDVCLGKATQPPDSPPDLTEFINYSDKEAVSASDQTTRMPPRSQKNPRHDRRSKSQSSHSSTRSTPTAEEPESPESDKAANDKVDQAPQLFQITPADPIQLLALPDGITARQAQRILAQHAKPDNPAVRTRKRTRKQRYENEDENNRDENEESNEEESGNSDNNGRAFLVKGSEEYKELMLLSRLRFARHFALIYEKDINEILIKVLGKNITKRQAADSYDNTYEKVKRWGRQWEHEIVKALTTHVSSDLYFNEN